MDEQNARRIKNRNRNITIGCAVVVVFFILIAGMIAFVQQFVGGVGSASSRDFSAFRGSSKSIGVIYINGVIHSGRSAAGIMGGESSSGSDTIVNLIEDAEEDDGNVALLLRVNSPGGSPAGSQEIYRAVMKYRKRTHRIVVVSMGDVAASGAYYISSAADVIFADPSTFTGSIGVIMKVFNYTGLFEKVGLSATVVKSVKYKDIGSPYRAMTPEEKAIIQSAIDNVHAQFISDVAKGRGLSIGEVSKIADGRLFTGEQALDKKLVDKMGGYSDALSFAAKQSGAKEPTVKYLQKENLFANMLGTSSAFAPGMKEENALQFIVRRMLTSPVFEGL